MKNKILGAVLLCLGVAAMLLPRFWTISDTYGDSARLASIIGVALLIFGLAFLLNITHWGAQMSAKKSGLVMLFLGGVFTSSAFILPTLYFDAKKSGAFLLPLLLAGLCLMGVGIVRVATARNKTKTQHNL
jgi:predicted phage tail protein